MLIKFLEKHVLRVVFNTISESHWHFLKYVWCLAWRIKKKEMVKTVTVMPNSHLPRTPCDKFVYDFPCDILGIVAWLRATALCVHIVYVHRAISSTGPRGQPGINPYRDCVEIVRKLCNVSAVAVQSPQPPHENRTEPVRGLCNATYDMSTGYGLTIFF